jgi:hypothetical protein
MNTKELELLLNQALVSKAKARYDVLKGIDNENYYEVQEGIEQWSRVDTFIKGLHNFVKEENSIANKIKSEDNGTVGITEGQKATGE